MPWPRDDAKLDRVRGLMAEQGLDAIVARAPDNVLYLTGFWGMKGWDAVVFPREGEPTLLCLEASADDAARNAWTSDVRLVPGYLADDPRPPVVRTLELAAACAAEHGTVGLELSLGTQASDQDGRRADDVHEGVVRRRPRRGRRDTSPRRGAHDQDRPGDRARPPRERDRRRGDGPRPRRDQAGDDRGADRRRMARVRARRGHGLGGQGRARAGVLARLGGARASEPSRRRATARSSRASRPCSRSGSVPTATGPTTRRTSSSASSRRRTPSWRRDSSRSTTMRSPSARRARASPSSIAASVTGSSGSATRGSRRIPSVTESVPGRTSRRTRTRRAGVRFAPGWCLQ